MTGIQFVFTALTGIPHVKAGDDLVQLILEGLQRADITLQDGDVLILAQKIVSKAENRLVHLPTVRPSEESVQLGQRLQKDPRIVELVLRESNEILRTRPGLLIVEHRLGFICANAGIDHSNVRAPEGDSKEWVLLLPENPNQSAGEIRRRLEAAVGARLAVLIIDSHGRAWRMGVVGVTIGASGFPALVDMRGRTDLYGDQLLVTQIGLADEVAAGASALMGQADEGRPVVHLRGLPYELREGSSEELIRDRSEDLFR